MRKIIIISVVCLAAIKGVAQSITINEKAIGFIVINDTIYMGTGFVMNDPYTIITCAHVVLGFTKISYVTVGVEKPFLLKISKIDIDNDIAVLKCTTPICYVPLIPDTVTAISPNQFVFYSGYNSYDTTPNTKSIQFDRSFVSAIGKVQSGGAVVDFIEFVGQGVPGYSGGPVINASGKVISVMREAWLKRGVKGGAIQLINRAFSIKSAFYR